MNHGLLQFISDHQSDDTTKLLLSRKKWPDIDIDVAVNTIEGRKRIAAKVPEWGSRQDLLYPTRLCTEQCSSTATALYKASIADRMGWKRIADLTGGLGVDSWYLAQRSEAVLHNEANRILSECVRENFKALSAGYRADNGKTVEAGTMDISGSNIVCRSMMVEPGNVSEVLDGFKPDVIFMDPARRSETGKKVFLIEDCQPDVLNLKDEIFGICRWIFLKLSPMADITMAVERLGNVVEVHTVATGGECKELLILMDRESNKDADGKADYRLFVHDSGKTLEFDPDIERNSIPNLPGKANFSNLRLFEPGKALAKAGIFNSLCERFGLVKIGRFTNLYFLPDGADVSRTDMISEFGKTFLIDEILPLDKRTLKAIGEKFGWADVTARNIPITSEELGKKMGLSPKKANGSAVVHHVFGVKADWTDAPSENILIVTYPTKK